MNTIDDVSYHAAKDRLGRSSYAVPYPLRFEASVSKNAENDRIIDLI
jgi:hypothetical protein